jgi:hypothetical protein
VLKVLKSVGIDPSHVVPLLGRFIKNQVQTKFKIQKSKRKKTEKMKNNWFSSYICLHFVLLLLMIVLVKVKKEDPKNYLVNRELLGEDKN